MAGYMKTRIGRGRGDTKEEEEEKEEYWNATAENQIQLPNSLEYH